MKEKKYMEQNNENRSNHNIPYDLILFILSELPLKSLKRFTCLSKSWALLFDNPHFMSMYRHNFISNCHYDNNSSLLIWEIIPKSRVLDHPNYADPNELQIPNQRLVEKVILDLPPPLKPNFCFLGRHDIHGTFCICPYHGREPTVLCNVVTGESLIVPLSPFSTYYDRAMVIKSGFGYDHIGDGYKLIQCWPLPNINKWEIYSVRSNTWRKLDVNMAHGGDPFNNYKCNYVYLNGVCHWRSTQVGKRFVEVHLVSFNLSTEVVLMTPFPVDKSYDRKDFVLDVLNGYIAVISKENNSICISILGKIGVEKSWTKLFAFEPLPCNLRFIIGAGIKGDILYIKKNGILARFDLSSQMIEEINIKEKFYGCQIIICKESPLPIRRGDK